MITVLNVTGWALMALTWTLIFARRNMWPPWFAAGICWLIADLMKRDAGGYFAEAGVLCFGLWVYFRRPKNRKRVKDLLGAKSKALRDALVRVMRELAPQS